MKLGEVLSKERRRKSLSVDDVALRMAKSPEDYSRLEADDSQIERWGQLLSKIAIQVGTPMSRLISQSGKAEQANKTRGQCGSLIRQHRERRQLSLENVANNIEISVDELRRIENGESEMEAYAPTLLQFAELVGQPIFNLLYPCGIPIDKLDDYP